MDKAAGPTSHDVVDTVRRQLQRRRVGHSGTLDPFATGLLIVLVDRATRLVRYLSDLRKEYEGVIRLGEQTTTDDATGAVTASSGTWHTLELDTIRGAMHQFHGELDQVPPVYSSKKIAGQPAHRRTRRGEQVELAPQRVSVFSFEPISLTGQQLKFRSVVGTGTYIRSLARDLGDRLGCGAHLTSLRRTAIGEFKVEEALEADRVNHTALQPPGELLRHLPRIVVGDVDREAILHGRRIESPEAGSSLTAAVFSNEELLAVAESRDDGYLYPKVVLN